MYALSNSDLLGLVLFVLSYYYPLEASLFSTERKKGSRYGWDGTREGTGRRRERQDYNQDILCKKQRIVFSIKGGGEINTQLVVAKALDKGREEGCGDCRTVQESLHW